MQRPKNVCKLATTSPPTVVSHLPTCIRIQRNGNSNTNNVSKMPNAMLLNYKQIRNNKYATYCLVTLCFTGRERRQMSSMALTASAAAKGHCRAASIKARSAADWRFRTQALPL